MSGQRRVLAYVTIALIVGAALALAVVLASGGSGSAAGAAAVTPAPGVSLLSDDVAGAGLVPDDPARDVPLLDRFTSKDPFVPLAQPNAGTGGGTGGGGTGGGSFLSAKVKVDGTAYDVTKGDELPGGDPAFTVAAVGSDSVTFEVVDGTLENGDTSVKVAVGESVAVTLDNGDSYTLAVVSVGDTGVSGGHTLAVTSISAQNGTGLATFEVDGQTYADKKVGDVFSTGWGEIKVLAIDVSAQTVTILHGDQTLTLRAGQVVVK